MINQHNLIPGIYNFCDTWCERCLFTNRCRSYQIQQEAGLAKPIQSGSDMVGQLTEALNLTRLYVEKLARAQRATESDAPAEAQTLLLEEQAVSRAKIDVRRHPAALLATEYLRLSGTWLSEEKGLLQQAGQRQLADVKLGVRTEDEAMPLLNALKDAWDMLHWYRTLIPVKTQSVLRSLNEPLADEPMVNYHLGKAKLVLVSIDRSLMAWHTLLESYPEKTDDLLDTLALLSRLRRELETLFPNARTFQRPGLD